MEKYVLEWLFVVGELMVVGWCGFEWFYDLLE